MSPPLQPSPTIAAIRLRPGMYIGDTGPRGIAHLVNELVANGLDQYLAGQASRIDITHRGSSICVSDDGAGLPYDVPGTEEKTLAETFFTELHDTPTADGHSPHVHLNPGGVGLIVMTALSSKVEVVSHRAGFRWQQRFENGCAVSSPRKTVSSDRGTSITFAPDETVLSANTPSWPLIRRKFFETAHLFPGVILGLQRETFHAQGGLLDLVKFFSCKDDTLLSTADQPSLQVDFEMDGIHINAAAYGTAKTCQWLSWCNGLSTSQHGTHVAGFKDALRSVAWTPAAAMIHVLMKQPAFNAPTKSSLATKHVQKVVRNAIRDQLTKNRPA
ncbi:hypothetical protein [Prosthecobacter fluviatilis]|uniref:DNA topoisomerase (ATP-hydrolyzing) n=1 Tax=Prosthecobacter fluviatilis TaxID=445931 RepID=A0ABW0KM48_9BACT